MPLQAQLELPSAFVLLSFEQLQQLECQLARLLLVQQLVLLKLQFDLRLELLAQQLECQLARLILVQQLAPLELQFGLRLESQESRQL